MIGRELRSGARHAVTTERRFFHKAEHIVWGQLTIARGVDEPTHLQFLREIGCHRGQGRLYSVPLPARHHS